MSVNFNKDALRHLTDNPNGNVARHVKKKADEITEFAREEAFLVTQRRVPREKFNSMVGDAKIGPSTAVIGVRDQIDSRVTVGGKSGRQTSITDYLAKKAQREKGDSWMTRAIKKHGYFKRRR